MSAAVLYIIDAPNMAHRAAAVGDLQTGLRAMLDRFLRVARPRYAVAVWDDRDSSFRADLWPSYKADRTPKDETIIPRERWSHDMTKGQIDWEVASVLLRGPAQLCEIEGRANLEPE